jgi:hypothetical protein
MCRQEIALIKRRVSVFYDLYMYVPVYALLWDTFTSLNKKNYNLFYYTANMHFHIDCNFF